MVQEEILLTIHTDSLFGCLVSEQMLPNEAILIKNAGKYMKYDGYADDFKVVGSGVSSSTIVAIDAMYVPGEEDGFEFSEKGMLRELNKAYIGF